jgi:hypothetical protein
MDRAIIPSFQRALLCVSGDTHSSILLFYVPFLGITRKPVLSRQRTFFGQYLTAHHALITSRVSSHS